MKLLAVVIALMFSSVAATTPQSHSVRTSKEVEYIIPEGSPVKFRSIGEYETVRYSGTFDLTGTYTYGYVTDDPEADATYGELELSFNISKQDAARLPYWSRDQPIQEIYIRNPDKFALQIIGRTDLDLLRSRRIKHIEGSATIVVRALQTTIDCDHQSTSVEFVSWQRLQDRRVASKVAEQFGC